MRLLDWASAGFYPRCFEAGMLKVLQYSHGDYEISLIGRMELSEEDVAQMLLLVRSFHNGIRYSFVSHTHFDI